MDLRSITAAVLFALAAHTQAQLTDVVLGEDNLGLFLELPDSAVNNERATLSVDIDGYDVTPFSDVVGNQLSINLDVPLEAGQHSLSVYLFFDDGSAEIVVDTLLDAPQVAGGEWSLNTLFESNYRADQHPDIDYQGIDEFSTTASLSFAGESRYGDWRTGASLDAAWDQDNGIAPDGDPWLLPGYTLYTAYEGEAAGGSLQAGDVFVQREDMLFSSYQRRGTMLDTYATSGRVHVQAFFVNSEPRNGFDGDYIFPGDSRDQTSGLAATWNVIDEKLSVGGGVVDGKSTFGGAGYNDPQDLLVYGGDSWNLSVDSRLLEDSIWLHLERAESDFDADGLGTGLPSIDDDATLASLQVSSGSALGSGPFEYWSAVLQYQRVGRDFYSLGNLSMPGNIQVTSAWLQAGFSSLSIDIDLAEEESNPDDEPLLPTQTLERAGISLMYSPTSLDIEKGLWKALGVPSISARAYRLDHAQPDSDALIAGFDLDNSTDEVAMSLTFARDDLSWGIEYATVDFDDSSVQVIDNGFILYEPLSDSRNRALSLTASWMPGDRISLDAYVQRNRLEETDFGNEYRSNSYGLSGNFVLMPERLNLFASVSQGQDRNRYGDPQFLPDNAKSQFANLQVNWVVTEPNGLTPGVNLFFKGNYSRNENLGQLIDDDFWSVFIGASVNWMESR